MNNVAAWDGTNWTSVGTGAPFRVRALASYRGNLIAAGEAATEEAQGGILRWDGETWHSLGGGVGPPEGRQIVLALLTVETNLYDAGRFTRAGDVDAANIARWDGSTWHPLEGGISVSAQSEIMTLRWRDERLFVSGKFEIPGIPANGLAFWDGREWFAYPGNPFVTTSRIALAGTNLLATGWNLNPVIGELSGVALLHDDDFDIEGLGHRNLQTVAGVGSTLAAGSAGVLMGARFRPEVANVWECLALWDGRTWQSLNQGLRYPTGYMVAVEVQCADVVGSDMVVGGYFPYLGTNWVGSVIRWDGVQWLPFGEGFDGRIRAVAWQGDRVVAAGESYGEPFGVVVWNGRTWGSLGLAPGFSVRALAVDGDRVFAAGTEPGATTAERTAVVAQWAEGKWTILAREPDASVNCLHHDGRRLVVGGRFARMGGTSAPGVATWDGARWSGLGDGLNTTGVDEVRGLSSDGRGRVFAVGRFAHPASGATNLAVFADGAWHAVGSWTPYDVPKSAAWWNGGLHVSGDFLTAGRKPSAGFGIWHGAAGDFELDVLAPNRVAPGEVFDVRLIAKRVAGDLARQLKVRLPLPAGVEFVSAEGGGAPADASVDWLLAPTNEFPVTTSCRLKATPEPGLARAAGRHGRNPGPTRLHRPCLAVAHRHRGISACHPPLVAGER